ILRFAGTSAFVAGAARAVILRTGRAQIETEAKAFVGQRNGAVRIAVAGGDAVAETGNEDVAHFDLGGDALRRVRPAGDVHGRNRGAAIAGAEIDRFGAVECGDLRPVAIVERPGAGGADRNGTR